MKRMSSVLGMNSKTMNSSSLTERNNQWISSHQLLDARPPMRVVKTKVHLALSEIKLLKTKYSLQGRSITQSLLKLMK